MTSSAYLNTAVERHLDRLYFNQGSCHHRRTAWGLKALGRSMFGGKNSYKVPQNAHTRGLIMIEVGCLPKHLVLATRRRPPGLATAIVETPKVITRAWSGCSEPRCSGLLYRTTIWEHGPDLLRKGPEISYPFQDDCCEGTNAELPASLPESRVIRLDVISF